MLQLRPVRPRARQCPERSGLVQLWRPWFREGVRSRQTDIRGQTGAPPDRHRDRTRAADRSRRGNRREVLGHVPPERIPAPRKELPTRLESNQEVTPPLRNRCVSNSSWTARSSPKTWLQVAPRAVCGLALVANPSAFHWQFPRATLEFTPTRPTRGLLSSVGAMETINANKLTRMQFEGSKGPQRIPGRWNASTEGLSATQPDEGSSHPPLRGSTP